MSATIDELRRVIVSLKELQSAAPEKSVFGGMTAAEATEYEERRLKIMQLSEKLNMRNLGSF